MDEFLQNFRDCIADARSRLLTISDDDSRQAPPGKWSPRQIVGHLIDSAANNHQRFVRAQFTSDLVCPGYNQEEWVNAQHYDVESWGDLVNLWAAYNTHLSHIISVIPSETLTCERIEHNLDQVAFKLVDRNQPATLEYFIRDYVDHMQHHLKQLFSRVAGANN